MKDMGEAAFILGMKITRDRKDGKLWVDQERYLQDILKRFNLEDCNSVDIPVDVNQKLSSEFSPTTPDEKAEMKDVPYQEVVGSLLYAAQISRPDIAYAVGALSKFNKNPGRVHWTAAKRVMRYLKGTLNYKLEFTKQPGSITGFSDADWASDLEKRRSTTGYTFMFQGGCVAWSSKRQPTVALSTTEAEYMAMSAASQEIVWLKGLYYELLQENMEPMTLFSDSKSAIDLAHNSMYHGRSKHIDIRHHFIRDLVQENFMKIKHVGTNEMVADALTKPLPRKKFVDCRTKMGLKDFNSSGSVGKKT